MGSFNRKTSIQLRPLLDLRAFATEARSGQVQVARVQPGRQLYSFVVPSGNGERVAMMAGQSHRWQRYAEVVLLCRDWSDVIRDVDWTICIQCQSTFSGEPMGSLQTSLQS